MELHEKPFDIAADVIDGAWAWKPNTGQVTRHVTSELSAFQV